MCSQANEVNIKESPAGSGSLFIVATPLGNLKDFTFRAVEILQKVDIILAEDTRRAMKLLNHYHIAKPLESYFVGNEYKKQPLIIRWLKEGKNIALISEGGTPCISDPGNQLVQACHHEKLPVIPVPGPSALTAALSASGIAHIPSLFIGFLPKSRKKQNKLLKAIIDLEFNIILYESPHRLKKTLILIKERFGNIKIFLFKELTKLFEYINIDNIDSVLEDMDEKVRGEYVLIFNKKII
ncbi:MAG: 16S rRNA (cytidine(1402)-2'-O)-methyltransferase [Spirochaetes bacterium]|nr:16S rRNA (cytidine(1402)-2'-O)-methyltransferase [Spirochaetota bacterium]